MLSHLGLNVVDLAASSAYYDELLPLLGYERFGDTPGQAAYRPVADSRGGYVFLYPASEPSYSAGAAGLQHLAFAVPTRAAVDAVHERAVALGSTVQDPPRLWPEYSPTYYAAFWFDPDGFKLEALCLR
jgi:catechol 2,3-dioxygenase-like lactoylglutathione lyase family enzyme